MPTSVKRNQTSESAREEWINDIIFFRDKCNEKTKFVLEDDSTNIQKRLLDLESNQDKYSRIKEKEEEDKQKILETKVSERTHLALEVN